MYQLNGPSTTALSKLRTEVEQRTSYAVDKCELNIFETHRKAENVRLTFDGFTITSMLRGKKVLRSAGRDASLNYLPGESFILPSDSEMVIDFPEANHVNPTQCTALVIENSYLEKQLEYINDLYPRDTDYRNNWDLVPERLLLQNDENVAMLSSRLIRIFSGNDPLKDILIDIKLKELVLSIMRLRNYGELQDGRPGGTQVNDRFHAVIEYIRRNITSVISPKELSSMACMSKSVFYRTFTNEFGVSPTQLILKEKINHAKSMMACGNSRIKEVCFALGFSDPNYFSRVFKKIEGITPGEYLQQVSAHK